MTAEQLTDIVEGRGVEFTVDGERLYVRPPSPEERDDAQRVYDLAYAKSMASAEVADLLTVPISADRRAVLLALAQSVEDDLDGQPNRDDLRLRVETLRRLADTQTAAQELSREWALIVRDRWLTARLVVDPAGLALFDARAPDFAARWNAPGTERLREAARPAIWEVLAQVDSAPFSLATLRGQPS